MQDDIIEFNKRMGMRIMKQRIALKYTREYLAEIVDISPKFLYEVETGKKGCSSYILHRISIALDVKTDSLLAPEKENSDSNSFDDIMSNFTKPESDAIRELLKTLYAFLHS